MKKQINSNQPDYFQRRNIMEKIVSNSRSGGKSIKLKKEQNDKIKERQIKLINKEYFPEAKLDAYDSSIESSQTTKMKYFDTGRSFGFRPKSSRKSGSMSDKSTKKSLKSLENQISNLTNELLNKEKALTRKNCFERIKQSEMVQLYRIISFYEGKIQQLEHQIKRYEQVLQKIGRDCDQKSKHKSQVQQLVGLYEDMRKNNEQLRGQLGQKTYTIGQLQNKVHKLQIKINFANSKSHFLKQTKSNLSKQNSVEKSLSVPHHINSAIIGYKLSQKTYGNIQSKINKIQSSLAFLKKENSNMQFELDKKENQIFELRKIVQQKTETSTKQIKTQEVQQKQKMLKINSNIIQKQKQIIGKGEKPNELQIIKQAVLQISQNISTRIAQLPSLKKLDPLNQQTLLPNKIFKEEQQSELSLKQKSVQSAELSQGSKQSEMSYQRLEIKYQNKIGAEVFKKLKYQLITEEVSHQQFVNLLIGSTLQPQILEQPPYNLNTSEAEGLYEWLNQLKQDCFEHSFDAQTILSKIIPKFTNLTIRKQNDMKIQICNEFLNRQREFKKFASQNECLSNEQMEKYFRNWGLSPSHLDIIGKSYYQQTGKINNIQIAKLKSIIQRWALQ